MRDPASEVATRLARYRAGGAAERTLGLTRVDTPRFAALVPAAEVTRAAALIHAADDFGVVSARTLARLLPDRRPIPHAVHLRTALTWIGAHITAK